MKKLLLILAILIMMVQVGFCEGPDLHQAFLLISGEDIDDLEESLLGFRYSPIWEVHDNISLGPYVGGVRNVCSKFNYTQYGFISNIYPKDNALGIVFSINGQSPFGKEAKQTEQFLEFRLGFMLRLSWFKGEVDGGTENRVGNFRFGYRWGKR